MNFAFNSGQNSDWKFQKYVGVQSWKAAHLPTLEIRVEERGNRVKMGENAATTGNRTQDPSITDQMSVLTNQVHLKRYSLDTDLTKIGLLTQCLTMKNKNLESPPRNSIDF